jgi:hypothetical protein
MSSSSEAVKTWRNKTKTRMVEAMGGKCAECGYNRCNDALEFHHIDPNGKDFTLGGISSHGRRLPQNYENA